MTGDPLYDRPDLYDAILPPNAEMAAFYLDAVGQSRARVLELGCGTGRFTVPLAQAGHEVVGIDASPAMLASARHKAAAAGVAIDFVEADMRDPALGARVFDAILLPTNSILHLVTDEDLAGLFAAIDRHLAPDGRFVFDVYVPDLGILGRDPQQRFAAAEGRHETIGRVWVEETTDYDPIAQVSHIDWYWSHEGARDFWHSAMSLRQIFPRELPLLLAAGGLRLDERFGGFDGSRFEIGSHRQACICTRL